MDATLVWAAEFSIHKRCRSILNLIRTTEFFSLHGPLLRHTDRTWQSMITVNGTAGECTLSQLETTLFGIEFFKICAEAARTLKN